MSQQGQEANSQEKPREEEEGKARENRNKTKDDALTITLENPDTLIRVEASTLQPARQECSN
jgi:hypothetical protein